MLVAKRSFICYYLSFTRLPTHIEPSPKYVNYIINRALNEIPVDWLIAEAVAHLPKITYFIWSMKGLSLSQNIYVKFGDWINWNSKKLWSLLIKIEIKMLLILFCKIYLESKWIDVIMSDIDLHKRK